MGIENRDIEHEVVNGYLQIFVRLFVKQFQYAGQQFVKGQGVFSIEKGCRIFAQAVFVERPFVTEFPAGFTLMVALYPPAIHNA